jgi:hypothetical protein
VHGIATQSTRLVAVCHLGAEIGPPNTRNAVSRLAPNPISRRLAWICQTIERPADESAKAAPPRRPCAPANDPAAPFFWGTMTQLGIIDMSSHPAFENFHHGGKGPDGPFLDRWRWRLSAWRAVAMLGHAGPSPLKYAANLEPRPSVSGCPQGPGPREARSQATPHARSQRRPQRTRSLMLQANAAAPLRIVAAIDNCPRRRRQRNDEVLLGFHPRRRIQARHSPTGRHAPSSLLLHALQRSEGEIASTGPAVSAAAHQISARSQPGARHASANRRQELIARPACELAGVFVKVGSIYLSKNVSREDHLDCGNAISTVHPFPGSMVRRKLCSFTIAATKLKPRPSPPLPRLLSER